MLLLIDWNLLLLNLQFHEEKIKISLCVTIIGGKFKKHNSKITFFCTHQSCPLDFQNLKSKIFQKISINVDKYRKIGFKSFYQLFKSYWLTGCSAESTILKYRKFKKGVFLKYWPAPNPLKLLQTVAWFSNSTKPFREYLVGLHW